MKTGARPVHIDKNAIATLVETRLVPQIRKWMARQSHPEDPIGNAKNIAKWELEVEDADGKNTQRVEVTVHAKDSKAKAAGVLAGKARTGEVEL